MKRIVFLFALALLPLAASAAGAPARPEFSITTTDGKTFDLAAQRGKWVIVNFWATWCSPCLKEMPDISKFVAGRKDVAAIGLAYDEIDAKELVAFLKKHPVDYPIAKVDVYDPPKAFETPRGLPTTYLIAPDGTIARHFVGPVTALELDKAIAAVKAHGG